MTQLVELAFIGVFCSMCSTQWTVVPIKTLQFVSLFLSSFSVHMHFFKNIYIVVTIIIIIIVITVKLVLLLTHFNTISY